MNPSRRRAMTIAAAWPVAATLGAAEPATADVGASWARLFAGPPGVTFAWWLHGTLFAHVDRLREFPVVGFQAVTICRTQADGSGRTMDFRTIGHFSDLDSGMPTSRWQNPFTGETRAIPAFFVEGPGRYAMTPGEGDPTFSLTVPSVRTNRIVATVETNPDRVILTQIEGTLQGFPMLDGALPPLTDPAVTERQTRIQIIARTDAPAMRDPRGYFTQVYDALPPWLGFGDALGSGLVKGQMKKAAADDVVDRTAWTYLRRHVPSAFAGDRLALG